VHELEPPGHTNASCAGQKGHCRLAVQARLADVLEHHGSARESVFVLVLEHSLDTGYVHVAKTLMP